MSFHPKITELSFNTSLTANKEPPHCLHLFMAVKLLESQDLIQLYMSIYLFPVKIRLMIQATHIGLSFGMKLMFNRIRGGFNYQDSSLLVPSPLFSMNSNSSWQ